VPRGAGNNRILPELKVTTDDVTAPVHDGLKTESTLPIIKLPIQDTHERQNTRQRIQLHLGRPFQALIDHFDANGIRYSTNREERRAWFTMNSGSALQKCSFRFDKTGDVLQIYIQYPVLVKEKFRPAAMEFITRANYGLVIGNFEMDAKDGEIRYHASHLMEENILTEETIRRLFWTAMGTADRYFPR